MGATAIGLGLIPLAAQMPASSAVQTPPAIAGEYLDQALTILRRFHINSPSADWNRITAEAHATARGAAAPADTYEAIRGAIRALGEPHTFLRVAASTPAAPPRPPVVMPSHELVDDRFGLVRLPMFIGTPQQSTAYSATLRDALAGMDRQGVCGWIIDLRDNGGGNMWPMLGGLDPLLGAAPFGSFRDPAGNETRWGRANGTVTSGPVAGTESPAITLRAATAPVALLIGPRTGSSGEMTAIGLIGRPGTRSFGAPTRGFTSSNRVFPLSDGATLVVTTAYVRDRTGHEYRGPIRPDETAEDALAAARRWLSSQQCRGR
jgi:hypothetical protein